MTIRIALLGLMLIVPGLQAMDLEFKQEKHETKKAREFTAEEREKPTTRSIWQAIDRCDKTEVARWINAVKDPSNPENLLAFPNPDNYKVTALQQCISCAKLHNIERYVDIAELLLTHKADPNEASGASTPPLAWSASFGYTEMAQLLLKHNANVDATPKGGGNTALIKATYWGYASMTQLLLSHGANTEVQDDKDGNTPLIQAARHAQRETKPGDYKACVKALLLAGADWTYKNKLGQTALDVARKREARALQDLRAVGLSATPSEDNVRALLTIPAHGSVPAFLDDMVQAQMPPANRKLLIFEQLRLRESGKLKSRKLPLQSTADASEGPAQASGTSAVETCAKPLVTMLESEPDTSDESVEALIHLPNTTSIKLKKLEPFSSGREMPRIKTYICES